MILFILCNPGSRLVTPTIAGKTYPVPYQHSEAAGKKNYSDQQPQTCGSILLHETYLV